MQAKIILRLWIVFLLSSLSHAGQPVWTLTPDSNYPPNVSVTTNNEVIVKYTVTNHSHRTHTLRMLPIYGVTQLTESGNCSTTFTLNYLQSCTLSLLIAGQTLTSAIQGGPILCDAQSTLQCYQPSTNDQLNIDLLFRSRTWYAGTQSGLFYFSYDDGITWTAGTTPSNGNAINSIFSIRRYVYVGSSDGRVYYSDNNGRSWNSSNIPSGASAINGIYVTENQRMYITTPEGKVFYSDNFGQSWMATSAQPGTGAANGIFVDNSNLYVASQNGNIYTSNNNGGSWNLVVGPEAASSTPVQNIFIANSKLYVNTRQTISGIINYENAYYSDGLSANPVWTFLSWITYTLFVNSDASIIYAGTQNGHIFSLSTGENLSFLGYSPINSLFLFQ